jgi:hypothetical protein
VQVKTRRLSRAALGKARQGALAGQVKAKRLGWQGKTRDLGRAVQAMDTRLSKVIQSAQSGQGNQSAQAGQIKARRLGISRQGAGAYQGKTRRLDRAGHGIALLVIYNSDWSALSKDSSASLHC